MDILAKINYVDGWFSPAECELLYNSVRDVSGDMLEIGHFLGRSTACIALAKEDFKIDAKFTSYDIGYDFANLYSEDDPFPQYLKKLDSWCIGTATPTIIAQHNIDSLNLTKQVTLIEGDFKDSTDKYDFIFCDALHDMTEINSNMTDIVRLSNEGCIWAFHDMGEKALARKNAIEEFGGVFIKSSDTLAIFKFNTPIPEAGIDIDVDFEYSIVKNKYGKYCVPKSTLDNCCVVRTLHNGGVYEPQTIQFMIDNCGDGDIVHAGAYIGDFIPALSKSIGKKNKVWAFEPEHISFNCAKATIELNDCANVKLFNFGLSSSTAVVEMACKTKLGTHMGGVCQILPEKHWWKSSRISEIEVITLDSKIPKTRKISILQLDVEGHEEDALRGAIKLIKKWKPILILEDKINITGSSKWVKENILSLGYAKKINLHQNIVLSVD